VKNVLKQKGEGNNKRRVCWGGRASGKSARLKLYKLQVRRTRKRKAEVKGKTGRNYWEKTVGGGQKAGMGRHWRQGKKVMGRIRARTRCGSGERLEAGASDVKLHRM